MTDPDESMYTTLRNDFHEFAKEYADAAVAAREQQLAYDGWKLMEQERRDAYVHWTDTINELIEEIRLLDRDVRLSIDKEQILAHMAALGARVEDLGSMLAGYLSAQETQVAKALLKNYERATSDYLSVIRDAARRTEEHKIENYGIGGDYVSEDKVGADKLEGDKTVNIKGDD